MSGAPVLTMQIDNEPEVRIVGQQRQIVGAGDGRDLSIQRWDNLPLCAISQLAWLVSSR